MNVTEDTVTGRKRGFALVFVMAFAAIIVVFTASVGAQATYNLRLANHRGEVDRAYYSAQTGTQLILSLLREPPAADPMDYNGDGIDGSWLGEDGSLRLAIESTNSEAIAHVYHNIQGYSNAQTTAPDGTTIPEDHFYIISIGVVNGIYDADGDLQSGTEYEATTMGATLDPSFPITPHAIFGYESINIDGVVGHFDSREPAPWELAPGGGADHMDCNFPEASVGIADVEEAKVTIGGNAEIDGHILFGFNTDDSQKQAEADAIRDLAPPNRPLVTKGSVFMFGETGTTPSGGGQPIVNGNIDELVSPRSKIDMTPDLTDLERTFSSTYSGSYSLDEGKIYLKEGNLILNGNTIQLIESTTDSDTELDDTILLVEGDIEFTNVTIGADGVTAPRTLKIYSLDTDNDGTEFNMVNSTAYCLVAGHAMDATIEGGSVLWGAILADKVTLESGSAVHFDAALRDPTIIADIYGYHLVGSTVSSGAKVATGSMGPTGTTAPAPAPAPAGPGPAPAPAPAPAPTGGGCGCGCGCGSMLMMNKL